MDRATLGVDGTDLEAVARRALQLAVLEPATAQSLCESVLPDARRTHSWGALCLLERGLGLSAMTLNHIDQAVTHLRDAVSAGERAGLRTITGEARMSLASALVLRGFHAQASRQIKRALRDLSGTEAARAHVQYAAILQELGRHDDALSEIRRALPVLRRTGDAEWEVRARSNRSLIYVARRAFAAAEADLVTARQLCLQHQLELPAGYVEQNLGCLKAQRGDVPASLRLFDAAAERYRRFGLSEPSLLVDRAGVLLSVRVLDEAHSSCRAAIEAYAAQRRDVHLPEAHLMLSTVALVQGRHDVALSSAVEAGRGFRALGATSSLVLARYAQIQAELQLYPGSVSVQRIARAADALESSGWIVPALEARVLAGRRALEAGHRATARRHLGRAAQARKLGPADARARAWLAEATLRLAEGRRFAALAALRTGLRIVEDYQATLGATELRAHVSAHRGELARSGLRLALDESDAANALCWAERGRAVALMQRPARPPEDPELAQALSDLRSTMAEIEEARRDGTDNDRLTARQVTLERRIRDRFRTLQGVGSHRPGWRREDTSRLARALGDAVLVEYISLDGALHAVTVAAGRVRVHRLGPVEDIRDGVTRLGFCLHRLVRYHQGGREQLSSHARAALRDAAEHLDRRLLRPLREVGDRPLVVVPSSVVYSLPWCVLPSCVGRPVTVSPSAKLWRRAAGRPAPDGGRTVVVAGPGLPGAEAEASTIAALHPRASLLTGSDATASAVAETAADAAMLHVAAHGTLRADNALFSSLLLADGPFTVYEMERLAFAPHHVVLAGCDTGRMQHVAGEEILGFAAAMLGGGTSTLVASVVPVPDRATLPVMRAYHQALLTGLSPAAALAQVQERIDRDDVAGTAAASGFTCLGVG